MSAGDLEPIGPTVQHELELARLRSLAWQLYQAITELDRPERLEPVTSTIGPDDR